MEETRSALDDNWIKSYLDLAFAAKEIVYRRVRNGREISNFVKLEWRDAKRNAGIFFDE